MDRVLNAVGINPRTLEMVMNADAMITIYEDIDKQWKIMSETSIIAKSFWQILEQRLLHMGISKKHFFSCHMRSLKF